jgi:hypothetical protein
MAEWRNGRMAEWRNGGMAEWRNGGMAEWHNVWYEIVRNQDTESTQMPPWQSPTQLVLVQYFCHNMFVVVGWEDYVIQWFLMMMILLLYYITINILKSFQTVYLTLSF